MAKDLWTAAKEVQNILEKVWIGDAEICFPELDETDPSIVFISEELSEVMSKAPEVADHLLKSLGTYLDRLRGYSVRVEKGHLSLLEGCSNDFLAGWSLLNT